jgi:hypothetical protein
MKNALERVWQSLVSGEEGLVEEDRVEGRVEGREEGREENRVERKEEADSSKETHVPLTPPASQTKRKVFKLTGSCT